MKNIFTTLAALGGHPAKRSRRALAWAIYIASKYHPNNPPMALIAEQVRNLMALPGKPESISQLFSRGITDIWEHGDRVRLAAYCPVWAYCKPKPKEFIYTMVFHLWEMGESIAASDEDPPLMKPTV